MSRFCIRDLPLNRTLDSAAMTRLRGAGGTGSWVAGWIIPYAGTSSAASIGGNTFVSITNNIFNQFISANQATFQTQNTEITNNGANAVIAVAADQGSATSLH